MAEYISIPYQDSEAMDLAEEFRVWSAHGTHRSVKRVVRLVDLTDVDHTDETGYDLLGTWSNGGKIGIVKLKRVQVGVYRFPWHDEWYVDGTLTAILEEIGVIAPDKAPYNRWR
jgi:hypothetical protein